MNVQKITKSTFIMNFIIVILVNGISMLLLKDKSINFSL